MADRVGFDLRCGGGQVAGKRCHRHLFLHRSRSNPPCKKGSTRTSRVLPFLADRVGFEPTVPLLVHLISSQGRYDRFDTCPYCLPIINNPAEKIKPSRLKKIYSLFI